MHLYFMRPILIRTYETRQPRDWPGSGAVSQHAFFETLPDQFQRTRRDGEIHFALWCCNN